MRYFRVYVSYAGYSRDFVVVGDSREELPIGKDGEMYWVFRKDGAVIVSIESSQVRSIKEEYVK